MFTSGGVPLLLALTLVLLVGLLLFFRRPSWFGRPPGDIRHRGARTRTYVTLTSMLLSSLPLGLLVYLLALVF